MKQKLKRTVGITAVLLATAVLVAVPNANAATDVNLILHWNLDEGSGTTAFDDSGNGYDGTLYNGGSYVAGHDGSGVSLNGVDQYIQTPTPFGFLGTVDQPYALSAWVNLPQTGESGNIFHMSSAQDGSGWCIPFLTITNGAFTATGWDQNGEVDAADTAQAASGQWYQVISTWDPTNGLRLFVDGTLVASTPQSDYAASGGPMYASLGLGNGACSNDQGYLNGVVDDARIYSRALNPADIQAISNEGTPVVPVASSGQTVPSNTTNPQVAAASLTPDTGAGSPPSTNIVAAALILLLSLGLLLAGFILRRSK